MGALIDRGMSFCSIKKALRQNRLVGPFYRKLAAKYGRIRQRKIQKAYRRHGEESFCRIVHALNDAGIQYFPAFGTMLGLVRDGRLIPHDMDIDFGVIVEEKEYDWRKLILVLEKAGFSVLHWFDSEETVLEMTFFPEVSESVHIDFFAFFRQGNQLVTHTCWKVAGCEYQEKSLCTLFEEVFPDFDQLNDEEYMGVTVPMPNRAEEMLEASYTTSWRIPNPQWKEENKPNKKEVEGVFARIHVNE